jgi:hypothetical protein
VRPVHEDLSAGDAASLVTVVCLRRQERSPSIRYQ